MPEQVTILANQGSGSSNGEFASSLEKKVAELGLAANLRTFAPGESATELARKAIEAGAETIVVAGGDGTMRAVAQAVAGTSAKLLPLPGGTFNHFARDLGIGNHPLEALELIGKGSVRQVDVGEVNGKVFLNNASLGLYPVMVSQRIRQERLGKNRWQAAFWAALSALRRHPSAVVRLSSGEEEIVRKTPLVFVGNNEYRMEGIRIGRRERLDSGRLCVYVLHSHGRLAMLRYVGQALFGRFHREGDFDYLCTDGLKIESRRKHITLALDGELMRMAPPLEYRNHPGALRVIVPKAAERKEAA